MPYFKHLLNMSHIVANTASWPRPRSFAAVGAGSRLLPFFADALSGLQGCFFLKLCHSFAPPSYREDEGERCFVCVYVHLLLFYFLYIGS